MLIAQTQVDRFGPIYTRPTLPPQTISAAEDLRQQLTEAERLLEESRAEVNGLLLRVARAESNVESARQETAALSEERWRGEVSSFAEQAKQHARTICALEERLQDVGEQLSGARLEVTQLKRQMSGKHFRSGALCNILSGPNVFPYSLLCDE